MRLESKVAIVTGASSGIGRSIALRFAEEGAEVVVADIQEKPREGGKPTHQKIKDKDGEAIFVETDVSSKESVEVMFQKTIEEFGRVDVVVNNAGIFMQSKVEDLNEDEWDKLMEVDLKGVYLCTKEAVNHMLSKNIEGSIINISSIAGLLGYKGAAAYCAAKGGVSNFTKEVALDYGSDGINVNAICPGVIKTEMTKQFREDPEMKAFMENNTPYKRLGEPGDIANAAVFLASDESNFIHGENLVVDGGWTIH